MKTFLTIISKFTKYLVVSGYVSISTGRARGTEDVDILLPSMTKDEFKVIFNDLNDGGFWCYQGDKSAEAFRYLTEFSSIRFAENDKIFPNI